MSEDRLSARERQVLALVREGKTTRQIAEELRIKEKTAGSHRQHVMEKLKVRSVAQLLVILLCLGTSCARRSPQLANVTVWHSNEHATLVKGKCSICSRHGLKSKVTMTTPHLGYCSRGHTISVP